MAKTITISADALEVLKRGACAQDGARWLFFLPAGKLERKLYEACNKALEAAGGKWNKKLQAHLYDHDPRAELGLILETGKADNRQQRLQFFPTPPAIAARMAELAGLIPPADGFTVLEPSAGSGALLRELQGLRLGALVAIEKDPGMAGSLADQFPQAAVECADFLEWDADGQRFDRILMNPPFERGDDIRHIYRALRLLKPGGVCAALCCAGPKQRLELYKYPGEAAPACPMVERWEILPPGSFKESGTSIDVALVLFRRPEALKDDEPPPPNGHKYIDANPQGFDSDCKVCGGKRRDLIHGRMAEDAEVMRSAAERRELDGKAEADERDAKRGR